MNTPFQGKAVETYLSGPPRQVPGYDGLLRMTTLLLAETVPEAGSVLVLGAGGGLEIREMADAQPQWRFDGVDPSEDMLALARRVTAPSADRVSFHLGYIHSAPQGPYDGATCILTMHFVPLEERLGTLLQVRLRLKSGAPFVMAHYSFPQVEPERSLWIRRHLMYSGTPAESLEASLIRFRTSLTVMSPAEEEDMLRAAGFSDVSLFYAGLGFRGWIAYAS